MRLDDLFVEKPIKSNDSPKDIVVEGSFDCQSCGEESETAYLREGKIWWKCDKCDYQSVAGGIG